MNNAFPELRILMVDDSEDDIILARKVFSGLKFPHKLQVAMSATEALDFLSRSVRHPGRKNEPPHLILLDLHMPGMDGLDLLRRLKADKTLRKIPVIMLTSSEEQEDIKESFECGAASYICKPGTVETYSKVMSQFSSYWTGISALPQ